jgi:hypothetical protein
LPFRDDLPPFVSAKLARCLPRCRTEVASIMSIASAVPNAPSSSRDPVARSPCARTGTVAKLAGKAEDASDPSLSSPMSPASLNQSFTLLREL